MDEYNTFSARMRVEGAEMFARDAARAIARKYADIIYGKLQGRLEAQIKEYLGRTGVKPGDDAEATAQLKDWHMDELARECNLVVLRGL